MTGTLIHALFHSYSNSRVLGIESTLGNFHWHMFLVNVPGCVCVHSEQINGTPPRLWLAASLPCSPRLPSLTTTSPLPGLPRTDAHTHHIRTRRRTLSLSSKTVVQDSEEGRRFSRVWRVYGVVVGGWASTWLETKHELAPIRFTTVELGH